MTIAVTLKVHEGVVLAADSAATLLTRQPDGTTAVVNVYDNANKIVNLVKGLPLGVITWGAGAIGPRSMTMIFKDLRDILTGVAPAPGGEQWELKPEDYQVTQVAELCKKYVYDHLYVNEYQGWADAPELGMIVAGYSTGGSHAEQYRIDISNGTCAGPALMNQGAECGLAVGGQPAAICRLIFGVDPQLPAVLEKALGVPSQQAGPATQVIQQHLAIPVIQDAMPFQDALDLADFLVDTTIRLTRFMPGASTVGGPIELAGITKHEGFKWIKRKHYYRSELNQGG